MGIRDTVGTLLGVIIGGPSYRVMGDVDAMSSLNEWTTESNATSGDPLHSRVKKVSEAKAIDIAANVDEYMSLVALAASPISIPLGYTTNIGATFAGTGRIVLGDHSERTGKTTVEMKFDKPPIKVG